MKANMSYQLPLRRIRKLTRIILILFLVISFTSCYHYKMVSQEETTLKEVEVAYDTVGEINVNAVAVFEFSSDNLTGFVYNKKDTLDVIYDFYDRESSDGSLSFKVKNKTSHNIFIDLQHSVFINNGRAVSYSIALKNNEKTLLVPDNSFVELKKFEGINQSDRQEMEKMIREVYELNKLSGTDKVFTKAGSPLLIRNKIVYGFEENMANPQIIDHSFWVSRLNVYTKSQFDLLVAGSLENKLVYSCNITETGKVTKHRIEKQPVKQLVTRKTKVSNPAGSISLVLAIMGIILFITLANHN